MSEGDGRSVLRCSHCNKPFDKQTTLNRHGYYCRSRNIGIIPRSRSCVSCAKGKTGCDKRRPQCSRCAAKGIECHYLANSPKVGSRRIQHDRHVPNKRQNTLPSLVARSPVVVNRQEANNHIDRILDNVLEISEPGSTNIGEEYLYWDAPDVDFPDFLNPQTHYDTFQHPAPGWGPLLHNSTLHTDLSIPSSPTSATRSLVQRPATRTGTQRITKLILHNLKSYLVMMLRQNTLPPFIHPSLMRSDLENNEMESLTNCICLVHMLRSEVRGSRKLFWKNVRLECERLYGEHSRLSKWELLAATQALSIYILIRLDEGETDDNNLDSLLITTVTVISKRFNHFDVTKKFSQPNCGSEPSWKDWIFEESKRRVCVIYQVVNMLVYFEPVAICGKPTDLLLAPLPSKKQLWEANDESVWKAESEREPGARATFGLATSGELVKLNEAQPYCNSDVLQHEPLDVRASPRSTANWEEWCSGMDGLGGLVMLAASLIA